MSSAPFLEHDAATARSRRDLYRFLSGCFLAPPGADTLDALQRPETLDELARAYGEQAVRKLRPLEVGPDEARREFDSLFVVPVEGFVSPCESVHAAGGDGLGAARPQLYGAPCSDVAKLMQEAGTRLPDDLEAPPDHIGVELLFLSFLWDEEGSAADAGQQDAVQRWMGRRALFLRKHPAAWIDTLVQRIGESTPSGFYAALSALVAHVLASDLESLDGADAV